MSAQPLHCVCADAVAPQPWRNGGGTTRELLVWPAQAPDWQVRISRADIGQSGPFSQFAGVARWFAVLEGAGVELQFADHTQRLGPADAPLHFAGDAAPYCRLVDGPTQDLNAMFQGGQGYLRRVQADQPCRDAAPWRGLYVAQAGTWDNGTQQRTLAAHTLLWTTQASQVAWHFWPDATQRPLSNTAPVLAPPLLQAWWLGFTPTAQP